jgi:HEAT repeat protein
VPWRGGTDDRGRHAGDLHRGADRDAIFGLILDAGERVRALLDAEDDREASGWLAATLGRLGHRPAIPDLIALLDRYRDVRTQAAEALGALRAGEATSGLQRMLRPSAAEPIRLPSVSCSAPLASRCSRQSRRWLLR